MFLCSLYYKNKSDLLGQPLVLIFLNLNFLFIGSLLVRHKGNSYQCVTIINISFCFPRSICMFVKCFLVNMFCIEISHLIMDNEHSGGARLFGDFKHRIKKNTNKRLQRLNKIIKTKFLSQMKTITSANCSIFQILSKCIRNYAVFIVYLTVNVICYCDFTKQAFKFSQKFLNMFTNRPSPPIFEIFNTENWLPRGPVSQLFRKVQNKYRINRLKIS